MWRQTHAMIMNLSKKGYFTVDELRRGIEALPAEAYNSLSYYEKWARSAATALTDRGVLTLPEIEAALGEEEESEPLVKRAPCYSPCITLTQCSSHCCRAWPPPASHLVHSAVHSSVCCQS